MKTVGNTHVCIFLQNIETSKSGRSFLEPLQEFGGPSSVRAVTVLSRDTSSSAEDRKDESGELHDGQHTKGSERSGIWGKESSMGTLENVKDRESLTQRPAIYMPVVNESHNRTMGRYPRPKLASRPWATNCRVLNDLSANGANNEPIVRFISSFAKPFRFR